LPAVAGPSAWRGLLVVAMRLTLTHVWRSTPTIGTQRRPWRRGCVAL